jgi:hypothetical protein
MWSVSPEDLVGVVVDTVEGAVCHQLKIHSGSIFIEDGSRLQLVGIEVRPV